MVGAELLKISHQSAGARGRRQSGQAGRQNAHMWRAELKSVRNWIKCAQLDKREKWCPNGAQNNRDIPCWVFSLTWITYGIQYSVGLAHS